MKSRGEIERTVLAFCQHMDRNVRNYDWTWGDKIKDFAEICFGEEVARRIPASWYSENRKPFTNRIRREGLPAGHYNSATVEKCMPEIVAAMLSYFEAHLPPDILTASVGIGQALPSSIGPSA